jgi:hypothetical protein
MSFFFLEKQERRTGPVWGLVPVGGEVGKGYKEVNMVQKLCICVNGKMRSVKTILGMRKGD